MIFIYLEYFLVCSWQTPFIKLDSNLNNDRELSIYRLGEDMNFLKYGRIFKMETYVIYLRRKIGA